MNGRYPPKPPRRTTVEDERSPAVIHRGVTFYENEPLPDLPLPKKVVVDQGYLHIDDTAVCFWVISKNTIDWLGSQITKWREEDPSEANRLQLVGIIEAAEQRIKQMPEELREYDRSALIEEVIIPFIDHLLEGEGKVRAFAVDIDQESATIDLESRRSFGQVTIFVPRYSLQEPTRDTEELSSIWPCPTLARFSDGFCRLCIDGWVIQKKENDCFNLAGKLPASFDIPMPYTTTHLGYSFTRVVLPESSSPAENA